MTATFELDCEKLLVFAALLLEGCGYYGCNDTLKNNYVPVQSPTPWQQAAPRWADATTLEIDFGYPLRPATEVDPRRFALVRYNAKIANKAVDYYYCNFDLCYRELTGAEAIPESLSWDPDKPEILRLHFTEPVPSVACEPWPGTHADYQALELIYLGVHDGFDDGLGTETGDPFVAEPDQLAFGVGEPVEEFGPERALRWLEDCFEGLPCDFEEFCVDRGGFFEGRAPSERWVACR